MLAEQLLSPRKLETLEQEGDAEMGVTIRGLGRFRVNVFKQRGVVGVVVRRVSSKAPTFEDLQLPVVMESLAEYRRGLILITGPAGTGKTTTIASLIGHINRSRRAHIITLEDPIEVLHGDGLCLVDQREVGSDMPSYAAGIRYAVRQDPDVLFLGEIRDSETAEAAIQASESGHLVISTMHTIDAAETVNRFIDLFPSGRQRQVRIALAGSLRAVMCQRLVVEASGEGRVPAVEVLIVNGRVSEAILQPGGIDMISRIMEEGDSYGMQTFDQALVRLVGEGRVKVEDALLAASNAHDFRLALAEAQLV
jgi:twitching motility protein PilT